MKINNHCLMQSMGIFGLSTVMSLSYVQSAVADTNEGIELSALSAGSSQKTYADAFSLFSQRSAAKPQIMDEVLNILANLENKSEDQNANYDVLILKARALYWKGVHAKDKEDKMSLFLKGEEAANAAMAIKDQYAEAYYFAGINLARWGEAKGMFTSLGKVDTVLEYINNALKRTARDGSPGESVDGYGPDRTLGRMYFLLPSWKYGDLNKAKMYLKKAVDGAEGKSDRVALNIVFYSESLAGGSAEDKKKAKQLLDDLLAQDPNTYNSSRVGDTLEDLDQARQLRKKLR